MYLPVLFQLVWGESATQSGISLIPLMCSFPFGAAITGVTTAKTGTYRIQPLVGAFLLTLGSGLFTTFTEDTVISQRIGFLIIAGISFGLIMISPMQTAQSAVLGRDRAVTTSTVSFFNMLGRLVATAAGQAIFNNQLALRMADLKSEAVAAAMAGSPWDAAAMGHKLAHAYRLSLTPVFYLGVAGGVVLFCGAIWCEHIPLSTGHHGPAPAANPAEGPAAAGTPVPADAEAATAAEAVVNVDKAAKAVSDEGATEAAAEAGTDDPADVK